MRGLLRLEASDHTPGAYHALTLELEDGAALRYHDMWGWGEVRALTEGELDQVHGLKVMGEEPLEPDWDGGRLAERLAGRRTPIKSALLDQAIVAGVGNIYADEALFRAGIHPERLAQDLSVGEARRLGEVVKATLTEAVESGGSRGEFVDLWGRTGAFVPQVYDRGGEPCPRCETPLVKIRLGGRGTTFCPRCQGETPGGSDN